MRKKSLSRLSLLPKDEQIFTKSPSDFFPVLMRPSEDISSKDQLLEINGTSDTIINFMDQSEATRNISSDAEIDSAFEERQQELEDV